jgi:PIN domain nuclease of toxin-antitoxin system
MRLLLDTHVFIWMDSAPQVLSPGVAALLQDPTNLLFVSIISIWEMQIKHQIGKLTLNGSLREILDEQQRVNRIGLLPLTLEHVMALDHLPFHHKDPFDRLLIAQAGLETLKIVTHDQQFKSYDVSVIW